MSLKCKAGLNLIAPTQATGTLSDDKPAITKDLDQSLFLFIGTITVVAATSMVLKCARTRIAQLCTKCAKQVDWGKQG